MGERRPDHGIKLHTTRVRLNSYHSLWLFFLSRFSVVSLDKVAAFLGLVREFPGVLPRVSDPQLFEKDATMCDEPKQV